MSVDRLLRATLRCYGRHLARRRLYPLHWLLFNFGLRGMGILNYEGEGVSGEATFLARLSAVAAAPVVIDVGAHHGSYSDRVMSLAPDARVYAFEPHPVAFQRLQVAAAEHGYAALNLALGDRSGPTVLYDYAGARTGSQHASLHAGVIDRLHRGATTEMRVEMATLDDFIESEGLKSVTLLKVDAEGSELMVVRGAAESLRRGLVDCVQFEFNEMNVFSRSFLRDFREALPQFQLCRMLPRELLPLKQYVPVTSELFAFQNIVAVREGSELSCLIGR